MKLKIIKATIIVWLIIIGIFLITRRFQINHNVSSSMPQTWWFTVVGDNDVKVGDYVVVRFHNIHMIHNDDYELVVKQVGGIGGDKIIVKPWIDSEEDGLTPPAPANTKFLLLRLNKQSYPILDRLDINLLHPLTTKDMVIPKGYYFIHGQHNPTFDSRYKEFGLISESQIYGRTYPLF